MFGLFKKKPKPDRTNLVPRIKNGQFGDYLRAQGVAEEELPIIEPLVADLFVTYAFDLGEAFIMTMPYHLEELGLRREELRDLAFANLKARLPNVNIAGDKGVHRIVTGHNLEACTLLSQKLWTTAASALPGGLIAVVPNRDVILFCDEADDAARASMMMTAAIAFATGGTHALSVSPLRWNDGVWETLI